MFFLFSLDIDKNIIQVNDNKNVKLLCQDLNDIALKRDWYIHQAKKYYIVLEIGIIGPESQFLFIAFLDFYLLIWIS